MRYFWIFIIILVVLAGLYFSGVIGGVPVRRMAERLRPEREA
jgi:hypothetical protein